MPDGASSAPGGVAASQACAYVRQLLPVVKRSHAYRVLHGRFAGGRPPQPRESWIEAGVAYYIFDLVVADEDCGTVTAAFALFVVHPAQQRVTRVQVFSIKSAQAEVTVEALSV